jgi:hypothetical protein
MATTRRGGVLGAEVEIYGLEGLLARLERVDPELSAGLQANIDAAAGEIADEARARIHYRTGRSFRGYYVQKRLGMVRVRNATAGGVISEFAGRVNPGGLTARGHTLIGTLNAAYGPPGRLVWAAWDERRARVVGRVEGLVEAAEASLRGV